MSDRSALFYYVARIQEGKDAEPVDVTSRVEGFTFDDREAGMDKLALTIDNRDLANFDEPIFEQGAKLRVSWGNGLTTAPPRDMVVKKVTGGRMLTVNCVSKIGSLMDTVKKRRCFASKSRSDVVAIIAKELGFNNPDIEDTPEIFAELAQGNLTDGQFLRKLAHLEGFEFFIDWEGLHWHRRRVGQAPVREYIYFVDPRGGEIIDFNIDNDVTRRPGKVTVKSRDPLSKSDIEASASNSDDKDRDVMQGLIGVIDGESGELVIKQEIVNEQTISSNVETQQDADREAKGKFRKAAQGIVKMTLNMRGDPALVAKTIISIKGMGKRISGKYYIKEISHALTAGGGYDMTVKVITDGFQSSGKKKGGAIDAANSLNGLASQLESAIAEDFTSGVSGESGGLTADFAKIEAVSRQARALVGGVQVLSTQQGDELRKNARLGAKALRQLASSAKSAKMPNTASAASETAATLDRIAEGPAEIEAQGKKNTKGKKDSNVTPVKGVDLDGNPVTTYVDTGGRTK